jgi:hypothetical protein
MDSPEGSCFPGRVYGKLSLLRGWFFLRGQQLKARSSPWIIISRSDSHCNGQMLACARVMESLWTTFFFISMWLPPFVVLFSVVLGCPGLCLDILLICMTVGVLWQVKECCGVENGAYVLLLVFVEGNE